MLLDFRLGPVAVFLDGSGSDVLCIAPDFGEEPPFRALRGIFRGVSFRSLPPDCGC